MPFPPRTPAARGTRMVRRNRPRARRGVAAVEMALVTMLFVLPLMIGVWEVGRLVYVQQVVSNAAREGARLASQAVVIKSDGTSTNIRVASGDPNVKDTVYQYLVANGLTGLAQADVTVNFAFKTPTAAGAYPADPYLGEKNQQFEVTVTVPWSKVRWVNLGLVNPTNVTFTVTWQMMVDDEFTVNDTLPTW